jgi:hypothetical protein
MQGLIMNNELERIWKVAVTDYRYNHGICLEWLRKSTGKLRRDGRFPGRGMKSEIPEYDAEMLRTRPEYWFRG